MHHSPKSAVCLSSVTSLFKVFVLDHANTDYHTDVRGDFNHTTTTPTTNYYGVLSQRGGSNYSRRAAEGAVLLRMDMLCHRSQKGSRYANTLFLGDVFHLHGCAVELERVVWWRWYLLLLLHTLALLVSQRLDIQCVLFIYWSVHHPQYYSHFNVPKLCEESYNPVSVVTDVWASRVHLCSRP